MTNNFLIAKELFLDIQFDEDLKQYGHEDTLFGLELKERQINILHLQNPLIHIGLEPTEVFLMKTKQGLQNLLFLSQKTPLIDSKLLHYYRTFARFKMLFLFQIIYYLLEELFILNFHSSSPSLRLFDLYKLGYLATLNNDSSHQK